MPKDWESVAYPSLKTLGSWVKDFHKRINFLETWATHGQPASFWISGFFFPQGKIIIMMLNFIIIGFLTGVLQNHARKYNIPIDTLTFHYQMTDIETPEDVPVGPEQDGVLVHGLYIEGARWDRDKGLLQDPFPMEMFSVMNFQEKIINNSFYIDGTSNTICTTTKK